MAETFEGKLVLIVDDDTDILTAITTALGDTGATLETASDGNTAVAIAEEKKPDVVILDIMLPGKGGLLVLERLRKNKRRGEKPRVIMITATHGRRHRQYAEALGVDEYLNKPFRMERLVEATEKLLCD